MLTGSRANLRETNTIGSSSTNLRAELVEKQVLVQKDEVYELQSDHLFKSASSASSVVLRRSSNGWTEWKDKNGKSMDEMLHQ